VLILLVGDTSADPFSFGESHFGGFLDFIESNEITTLSVKGNWDGNLYDSVFEDNPYKYVHEISNQYFDFGGLTFLGIPYDYFNSLHTCNKIITHFSKPVDFIIAHPATIRRIWLFDLCPKYIVVGHDDTRVCSVNDSLFIAINHSPANYVILNIENDCCKVYLRDTEVRRRINFDTHKNRRIQMEFEVLWENNKLNWTSEIHSWCCPPHTYPEVDTEYGKMFEQLLTLKKIKDRTELIENILTIYKKHIDERYLSNKYSSGLLSGIRTPKTLIREYLKVNI
jgi:hypothetical protein